MRLIGGQIDGHCGLADGRRTLLRVVLAVVKPTALDTAYVAFWLALLIGGILAAVIARHYGKRF